VGSAVGSTVVNLFHPWKPMRNSRIRAQHALLLRYKARLPCQCCNGHESVPQVPVATAKMSTAHIDIPGTLARHRSCSSLRKSLGRLFGCCSASVRTALMCLRTQIFGRSFRLSPDIRLTTISSKPVKVCFRSCSHRILLVKI